MKLITKNEKWKLYLVDPDEVFDILGNGDGKGLYCKILKGTFQKATHELRNLKVYDIKNYITAAKDNDPNEFIIFYRVVENKENRKLRFRVDDEIVEVPKKDILEAKKICTSGPCGSQRCPFHVYMYPGCHNLISKYDKGDYEEVDQND